MASETSGQTGNPLESVRYTAGTDIGMRRDENQDSFGVVRSDHFRLFIVADGMGGVKGGATASGMAVNIIEQMVKDKSALTDASLVEAVSVANRMIFEKGNHDSALNGMGTTLVALAFVDTRLIVANVGDSRAYRVRGDRIKRLTEDHTLVMELVRSGTISLEQAGNHPVSHMLTRSLGPTPEVEVDCGEYRESPQRGDRYLLCSDGLYNLVAESEMLQILNTHQLDEAIEVLIDMANQRGGTDNITCIIVEVDESYPVERAPEQFLKPPPRIKAPSNLGETANGAQPVKEEPIEEKAAESAPDESASAAGGDQPDIDLFAIPDGHSGEDSIAAADDDEPSKKEANTKPAADSDVRSNPVIAGAVSMEQVAKEAGIDLVGEGESSSRENVSNTADTEAIEQPQRASNRSLIFLGVLAGLLGGAAAVLLFRENVQQRPRIPISTQAVPGPLDRAPLIEPRATSLESEFAKSPIQDTRPSQPPLDVTGPAAGSNGQQPIGGGEDLSPAPQPGGGTASDEGQGNATTDHLRQRAMTLAQRVADLKDRISLFDQPLTGDQAKLLEQEAARRETLKTELAKMQAAVDTATRKLAIWYGRRTRLQETDLTNLATEVAISSSDVKDRKEAFELATWEYLKEAEVLRYLPTDRLQKKKVDDLAEVRNRRLHELTDAVHSAIDREIRSSEEQITKLTLQRETISEQIDGLNQNINFLKALMGGDAGVKAAMRQEVERELAVTQGELREVEELLQKVESAKAESAPAADESNGAAAIDDMLQGAD